MANNFLQNGLLGMGGFGLGGNNMPANSLLGEYYDPAEMRKYQMKQMLLGLGAGLMAEKGVGKGAALALAAGDRAGSQYRDNAMDAYRIKSQQDQQAKADERWQKQWDYNVGQDAEERKRQSRIDAQNNTLFGLKMDEQQRLEDQRQGQQDYVTGWMGNQSQQGASLPFSPGVRSIARQGGVTGPSSADQWRFDNAQSYAGAQDFGKAFEQIAASPEPQKAPSIQTIYDEKGQEQKVEWRDGQWVPVGGSKPQSGGITIGADGTVQIGGPGGGLTQSDNQAILLQKQAESSFDTAIKYFDELSSTQNTLGSNVPGGRAIMSDTGQAGDDAMANIVANWLYITSGATAQPGEVAKQVQMLKPTALDGDIAKAEKKVRLNLMIDAMRNRAGVPQSQASGPTDPALNSGPGAPNVRKYNPATGRLE